MNLDEKLVENKVIKEVDVTKYKITDISQIFTVLAFIVLFAIAYFDTQNTLVYLLCTLIFLLCNKFPHELSHYLIGRIQGFKCTVKFGFFMSECRTYGVQTYKQVIAQSLAPLYIYLPVTIILLLSNKDLSIRLLILSLFVYAFGCMIGDFIYVYTAFTHKNAKFTDNGHTLIIEK